MKTILIFVSTLDGKITKWGDPFIRSWSSKNDQNYFDRIWNATRVIIMGSGTYDPAPIKPDTRHLFVVITRHPERYKNQFIAGHLEFTGESIHQLMDRFKSEKEVLIVGGAQVATSFLQDQLIDELWLTIEPKIFGSGASIVTNEKLEIELKLISCESANDQGTLFTRYQVIKKQQKKKR